MSDAELIFRMIILQWRVTSLRCWWYLELLRRKINRIFGLFHHAAYRWMVLGLVLALFSASSANSFAQGPSQSCHANAGTPVVVSIAVGDGTGIAKQGSGVIMRTDGLVLTSYDLVRGASQIELRMNDGSVFNRAVLVAFDEAHDLAALRVSGDSFTVLPAASERILPDQSIFVIGRDPDGRINAAPGRVVSGAVDDAYFSIAAPIEKGTLGSPVFDCQGRLLGVIAKTSQPGPETLVVSIGSVLRMTTISGETLGSGKELQYPGAPVTRQAVHRAEPDKISRQSRTFALRSSTMLIPRDLMLEAVRNQPGFAALDLVLVENSSVADVMVDVDYVPFTFDYTFKAWERSTSVVIAGGKITAFNGYLAAPKLAAKLVAQLTLSRNKPRAAP